MNPALQGLLANGPPSPAAIDAFMARHKFPLIDPLGVTFVYRGEAESVLLRCWISGLPTAQSLERFPGTDLWLLRIDLPQNSRFEYKLDVKHGETSEWITDPL